MRKTLSEAELVVKSLYFSMTENCRVAKKSGRDVCICDEWKDFNTFYKWAIENNYKKGKKLVRNDYTKGFNPENCRISDSKKGGHNSLGNIKYRTIIAGEAKYLWELAQENNIPYQTLYARLVRRGWDLDKAVNTPVRKRRELNEQRI